MVYKGTFIAIEGTDGSGLSTQAEIIRSALSSHGITTYKTKEPTDGPVGAVLRLALTHRITITPETFALLFAADRMDHLASDIIPRLETGTTVLCDRYFFSNFAYQGMDMGLEWLREINKRALVPDVTVFIDVTPDVCLERMESRMRVEFFETREKLEKIRANFLNIFSTYEKEYGAKIVTVDGSAPIEEVKEEILSKVIPIIEAKR